MKHSTKMVLIEIGIIFASLFCLIFFNINYYVYLLTLVVTALLIHFLLKTEKREERFSTEIILIIVISLLFYYAITYFFGFFTGFYYSTYSKSILGIIRNILYALIIIFSIENIREDLIKNYAYHKSIVYITPIICCLLELPSLVSFKVLTTKVDVFYAFLVLMLPSITKNVVLTFITFKSNRKSSITYQLLKTIPLYILPTFPNFGEFLEIVINMLLPVIVLVLVLNITNIKFDKIKNSRALAYNNILTKVLNTIMVFIILIVIYFTSGIFRYYSLAIGSSSMKGSINKGDVVIIDKKYKSIKEKDVIAFKEQGKVVVHRVVKVRHDSIIPSYKTKGDNNKNIDSWIVKKDSIVGKEVLRIRWIGWPTVILSELLQNKG